MFPNQLKNFIGVIRGNRRSDFPTFENNLNEFLFVFAIVVIREPVVEILATDPPTMCDSFWAEYPYSLNVLEEDGFWGGEGKEILVDDNEFLVDGHLVVMIEYFAHLF